MAESLLMAPFQYQRGDTCYLRSIIRRVGVGGEREQD